LYSAPRYFVAIVLTAAATAASLSQVRACERCRRTGTTAFHIAGGDDRNDALVAPPTEDLAAAQFALIGQQWPQPGGNGTPVTITYSYQNMFDGGLLTPSGQPLPNGLIRSSIEDAFGLWANVAPLHFVEVPDDGNPIVGNYANGQFGQIRFRHVYINGPDIPGQPPIAKAQAYYPYPGSNYAGDVEFDHSDRWQEVGTLPLPDILGAAIHEIGHSLGLAHTNNSQANMYWIFTRYAGPGTAALHADDVAGIRAIYGSGVGSVTPLVAPEPASSALIVTALLWLISARRLSGIRRVPCPWLGVGMFE
jgi:Matrixin